MSIFDYQDKSIICLVIISDIENIEKEFNTLLYWYSCMQESQFYKQTNIYPLSQ